MGLGPETLRGERLIPLGAQQKFLGISHITSV